MKFRPSKRVFIPLLLPVIGFYSSVVESCPAGIAYQDCSGCHFGGTYSYSATWSSIPTVIERNSSDTVTFSMSGTGAAEGGFSATTDRGTFTATGGETNITPTNVSQSIPSAVLSWSFTFNSGPTSGTATLNAFGNPVNGVREADNNDNSLCGGTIPYDSNGTGTADDGNTGSVFPAANTTIIVNDSPAVAAGGGSDSFTEDGSAVTVAPSLSITDYENTATEIQSGSVTITTGYNASDGDVLNINGATCTSNNLSCSGSGTRTITISGGPESAAEFQNVLRAITFSNTSQNPNTSTRTVQFSVTDQHARAVTSTRGVTVDRVEDPADFDSPVYNRIGVGTSSSTSQTIVEDVLTQLQFAATDPEGVSTTFSLVSTTPTLTGPEPLITVSSGGLLSWTPDGTRTSVTAVVGVNDNVGGSPDNTFSITLNVTGVNDAPVINGGAASVSVNMDEDNTPTAFGLVLTASDLDGDTMTWSIDVPPAVQATKGVAATSGTGTSKVIAYTPNLNENGMDSFVVRVFDGIEASTITVNLTINAINDPPVLAVIGAQTATENTPFSFDADTILSDPDDTNNGTDITWSFQSGEPVDMTISNIGVINWTPPQTGVFNQSYGPIIVRAADGGEDGAIADTQSFTILVSPPDGDSDNVADYNDLCLTVSDSTNADNDGDGTAGTDGGVNDGGDACDLDDDNDGMPDTFENANGLDPFDAADANGDADGDGVSNLDEYLEGTDPTVADEVIDATGYYTPVTLTPPVPTSIHPAATGVRADNLGPYRPGRTPITWTAFNSSNDDLGSIVKTLKIQPILSFAVDQIAAEGGAVTVTASLNGPAPNYPVTATYIVGGTAGAGDHDGSNGSLVFNDPDQVASFNLNLVNDNADEGEETVIFSFTDATNAVIGNRSSHTVTIVEGNVLPQLELRLSQSGMPVSSAFVSEGDVTVDAVVSDVNSGQSHSLDWSATDNSLVAPTNSSTSSWTFTPAAGNYLIDVEVTDNGSPAMSNRVSRVISISTNAPTLAPPPTDTDEDGTDDQTEGFDDSDGDGVPDYLDINDGAGGENNLLPNQTVDFTTLYLIETEPGLTLTLGNTASAANNFGAIVSDADIKNFGSARGDEPLGANDDFEHVGGAYDFEIKGLAPAAVVAVVIPLQTAIPANAEYRKFHADKGWSEFVVDDNNWVASSRGELGACPEPGSVLYLPGLNYLDNCLQLTIEDGGPNDIDGVANGVIKDPGSIGVELQDPETPKVKGGGWLHLQILLWLLSLLVFQRLARHSLKEEMH